MTRAPWRVWVDTGGTFTDCLATSPSGRLHRVKVLSTSALRSKVREVLGRRVVRLSGSWDVPDGFFTGARLRILAGGEDGDTEGTSWGTRGDNEGARVRGYSATSAQIEVEQIPRGTVAGAACEILAGVEAPVLAAHLVTRTPLGRRLPPIALRLATTRGTNALLERRGAPTVLFITRGFGDLLVIGSQQRPDLFALDIRKPAPYYSEVVEVPERLAADGSVLLPLATEEIRHEARRLAAAGARCAAVALMHSYRNPSHEQALARLLLEEGFEHVSCSAELAPLIKLLPRAETAVIDAHLGPVIGSYLHGVARAINRGTLHVMTSAGGLIQDSEVRAKDTLLSGPAGGVVGAAIAARRSGISSVIAFDMGGTSTDVSRWHEDFEYVFEHQVGDARLVAPALAIESVAAGGGSICSFDGSQLRVGPQSAGADPGPACYGAGGPLALTDVNLLLGRIVPERFEIPITKEAAELALERVQRSVAEQAGQILSREETLQGFLQIANERMANAIRSISIRKGHDLQSSALLAFGGAGPQHACAVAELLGMDTVIVPPDASLLSAGGLEHAVVERFAQSQVLERLEACCARLPQLLSDLACQARQEVQAEGVAESAVEIRRTLVFLRLLGQEAVIEVEWHDGIDLAAAFTHRYRKIYGYQPPERPIEVESLRVVASTRPYRPAVQHCRVDPAEAPRSRRGLIFSAGSWGEAGIYERDYLEPGSWLKGGALVLERHCVTVVEPGWHLMVDGAGALILRRTGETAASGMSRLQGVRGAS